MPPSKNSLKLLLKTLAVCSIGFSLITCSVNGQQLEPTPQLLSVFPVGGKAGTTVEVKIVEQVELEFADQLIFSHPGITAKPTVREKSALFPEGEKVRNSFQVSIGADIAPGIYSVRAVCEYGVSNSRRFVVTNQNEVLETEPNNELKDANDLSINTTVNGLFEAGYDLYEFNANAGEKLLLRCDCATIDSRGDAVIAILNDQGKTLKRVTKDAEMGSTVVDFIPESSGVYYARLNDLVYTSDGGVNTTPYRFSISKRPWIDFIDPPVGKTGSTSKHTIYGRNIGGKPSQYFRNGSRLEKREVQIQLSTGGTNTLNEAVFAPFQAAYDFHSYQLKTENGISNSVPIGLLASNFRTADEPNDSLSESMSIKLPALMVGKFDHAGDVDSFIFEAKKGDEVFFRVDSEKLGLPTDPFLAIQIVREDKDKKQTAREYKTADDLQPLRSPYRARLATNDAQYQFVAPNNGKFRVVINDQFNANSDLNPNYYVFSAIKKPRGLRLLAVPGLKRGLNGNNQQLMQASSFTVHSGAATEIQLIAYRNGQQGTIRITAGDLPNGTSAKPTLIRDGDNLGALVIHASKDAKKAIKKIKLTATIDGDSTAREYPIKIGEVVRVSNRNNNSPMRLTDEIILAVDDSISFPGRLNVKEEVFRVARAGKIELSPAFEKQGEFKDPITQVFAYGLPQEISKNTVTLPNDGKPAKITMTLRETCPVGTQTFFLRGYADYNTTRFKKGYDATIAIQKRLNQASTEAGRKVSTIDRDRKTLERKSDQLRQTLATLQRQLRTDGLKLNSVQKQVLAQQNKIKGLKTKLGSLSDTVSSTQEKLNASTDEKVRKEIADALAKSNNEKQKLVGQLEKLEKETLVLSKQRDSQKSGLDQSKSKIASMTEEKNSVDSEITILRKKEAAARDFQQKAQLAKRRYDNEVNQLRQVSQQRRRRFYVYSKSLKIEVVDFPAQVSLSQATIKAEIGQEVRLKAFAKREFEYDGEIQFAVRPPQGANGWKFKGKTKIEKSKNETELTFTTEKYAKPGTYNGSITALMTYNGRRLTKTFPMKIELAAAKK